jgi:hypothetical protein
MTTKKESSEDKSISKHKATRRAVQTPAPQAFDIIPRNQVRPSTTSRPVIPSNQPEVADNTMTTSSHVRLNHQIRINPGAGEDAENSDDTAIEASSKTATLAPPEQGVSVSDLLAKKNAVAAPDVEKSEAETVKTTEVESEPAVTEDSDPAPELAADKPAAEEPADDKPAAETTKPAETAPDSKPAPAKSESENANDALADVLRDDTPGPAPAHSEVLKEAIKELDEDEVGKDGRHHHELYGGKPVIVVHKDHGTKSALMWALWFFLCVGLAVLIVNFLLDANVINTSYNVPHTDLLK